MASNPQYPNPKFLPVADEAESIPAIDQHLSEVEEACQKVASEVWDLDQFHDYIVQLAERLNQREDFIKKMPIPEEILEEIREELELGFSGITYWNDGVARLALFPDDPDIEHLEEGLDLCRQGNELLNEAAHLNRANYKRVETLFRESTSMT